MRTKLVAKAELCYKVPTPEIKEDFTVCTCAESLLGGQKGKEPIPIINVNMHPQAFTGGSIITKSCTCMLGWVLGPVRCEERNNIIAKGK